MKCSQCGSDVAAGVAACPNCGAAQPNYAAQGGANPAPGGWPQPGTPGAPAPASFNFDAGRWTRAEQITGGATLLLLISLFLPWFTASISTKGLGLGAGISDSVSVSGTGGHGYLWIVFIVSLAILAFLVIQAGFSKFPVALPVAPERLLLGLTGLNLLLVLLAFLIKPGTGDTGGISVSVGWGFGAFVGLICAIAAFVPLVMPMARERAAAR